MNKNNKTYQLSVGFSLDELMVQVLDEAREAASKEEVPVAAMILDSSGVVLSLQSNRMRRENDPTAHAEILAIREACRFTQRKRLEEHTMIVSLEPCAMCAAAIACARIKRLVFGAYDPKAGAVTHGIKFFDKEMPSPKCEIISGVLEEEAASLLKDFFQKLRQKKLLF